VRRRVGPQWLSILALVAAAACNRPPAPVSREVAPTRGYVLISIDTLRADHLGLYGYQRPTSPFLDSLATRAAVFEHAIVQLPGTLPSHMSIFTSLYPPEHGVYPPDGILAADTPTLPEVLQRNGFRTAGFTEGGYMAGRFGFARGFDEFDDDVPKRTTDIETTCARGLRFLTSLDAQQRFFLFLHTYVVHDPYRPPERYRAMFAPAAPPPQAFAPTGPNFTRFNHGHGMISAEARDYYRALYDAEIRYMDDVLKRFFDELARLGLDDETTVVVTSDHGEEFLEHGKMVHEQLYHEVLRVPLLIVHPDPATRGRIDAVVQSIDIAPTLYAIADVPAPARMSGASLVPYLAGQREPLRRDAYAEAFVSRDRAVYRAAGPDLHHLIVRRPGDPGAVWVGRSVVFDWPDGSEEVAARPFHAARRVRIAVNDALLTELVLEPNRWSPLPLGDVPRGTPSLITLTADDCVAPSSVSSSRDDRCLAFQLRGTTAAHRELYDVRQDQAEQRDLAGTRRELTRELEQLLMSHQPRPVAATTQELDPALKERLRSLGYDH